MRRRIILAVLSAAIVFTAFSQEGLSLAPNFELAYDKNAENPAYNVTGMDFGFESKAFSLSAELFLSNDGKYSPLKSNQAGGTFFDYYAFLKSGGIEWRPGENLSFRAGRLEHRDQVEGPYSLFVSSAAPSALLMQIRYENDYFAYESRWVELNSDSSMYTDAYPTEEDAIDAAYAGPFPDRGANVKAYILKLDRMRFGLQDAAVYTGRSFDAEYFLSPLPQYFTQYVKGTSGRPWETGSNENNIIGAFWIWDRPDGISLSTQLLMDDFNLYRLGIGPHNPWKAAWSGRVRMETSMGNFAFSHAGALKYTFQPTYDRISEAYSYTYYPDTRFTIDESSDSAIAFEDLMFGYKHGENNLAFRVDYDRDWGLVKFASYLEFVLSGAKSPTNAWHDEDWHDYRGSRLLDDDVLEKLVVLNLKATRRFGNLTVLGSFLIGAAFNALELSAPEPEDSYKEKFQTINLNSYIWKPGDDNKLLFAAAVGVRYQIPVMGMLGK